MTHNSSVARFYTIDELSTGQQIRCSYSTYTEERSASEAAIEFALLSF